MSKLGILVFLGALSISLTGCGKDKKRDVDPSLDSYVTAFENASVDNGGGVKVDNLSAQFGDLDNPSERGVCVTKGDDTPTITISKTIWDRIPESERRELMFHELGHCVLFREHLDALTNDGHTPASLMNKYAIQGTTYSQYEKQYEAELFSRKTFQVSNNPSGSSTGSGTGGVSRDGGN